MGTLGHGQRLRRYERQLLGPVCSRAAILLSASSCLEPNVPFQRIPACLDISLSTSIPGSASCVHRRRVSGCCPAAVPDLASASTSAEMPSIRSFDRSLSGLMLPAGSCRTATLDAFQRSTGCPPARAHAR